MIKANIISPVGEFIVVFLDMDEAYNKLGSDTIFNGKNDNEIVVIPLDTQAKSVFILSPF